MNKLYLVIIAVVLVAGAWFLFQGEKPTQPQKVQEIPKVLDAFAMLMENVDADIAILVGVESNEGSGVAYRSFSQGEFLHAVVAEMPLPAEGSVYEGWLVQPEPLQFFSTGIMEQNAKGEWVLEYMANIDYPSYNKVIITEETIVDETPEAHILEGDF